MKEPNLESWKRDNASPVTCKYCGDRPLAQAAIRQPNGEIIFVPLCLSCAEEKGVRVGPGERLE